MKLSNFRVPSQRGGTHLVLVWKSYKTVLDPDNFITKSKLDDLALKLSNNEFDDIDDAIKSGELNIFANWVDPVNLAKQDSLELSDGNNDNSLSVINNEHRITDARLVEPVVRAYKKIVDTICATGSNAGCEMFVDDEYEFFVDKYKQIMGSANGATPVASGSTTTTVVDPYDVPADQLPARLLDERRKLQENLHNFFLQFSNQGFEWSNRIHDTATRIYKSGKNMQDVFAYVDNYLEIGGANDDVGAEISNQIRMPEFTQTFEKLARYRLKDEPVNKHLIIYYGNPGVGKTYTAMQKYGSNTFVCHSGILPQDIFKNFDVKNGVTNMTESVFIKTASTEKAVLILDEFNTMLQDTKITFQGITDNKDQIVDLSGQPIKLAKDYVFVITMNLFRNGVKYPLPEAVIDRAFEIRKFVSSADMYDCLFA